jgi:transposase-like protein
MSVKELARRLDVSPSTASVWVRDIELDGLEPPHSCLRKSTVNVYSKQSKKRRRNRLPYGTCRLVVHDTRIV